MENDILIATKTADGIRAVRFDGEAVSFARQNKAVRDRLAAQEKDAQEAEAKEQRRMKAATLKAAQAAQKRQEKLYKVGGVALALSVLLGILAGGLIDPAVGVAAVALAAGACGYQIAK